MSFLNLTGGNEKIISTQWRLLGFSQIELEADIVQFWDKICCNKISDISNGVVRGLDTIGYNERDHWLFYMLQNMIDGESRRKWVEKSRNEPKQAIN